MFSILDIETTGAHALQHHITEIAIINFDGEKITDRFSTLIRPESDIPFFISQLTGITQDMVDEAPLFEEVADAIEAFTKDRIVVAHNAHFDYTFLKRAFQNTGKNFQRKTLCTLQLSRKIIPGLPTYSLDHLCRRLNIESLPSHRAESDAMAALQLLQYLIQEDQHGVIETSLKKKQAESQFPPHVAPGQITALPQIAGVYFFHDQHGKILYVGKAKNLKSRVHSHFSGTSPTKAKTRLMNRIHEIRYEACGSELVAMLMESALIKKYFPPFNSAQKISDTNYGVYNYEDGNGYLRFGIKKLKSFDRPLLSFASLQEARNLLEGKKKLFRLCPKLCGLQQAPHACYDADAGSCYGACMGKETAEVYNLRVKEAMDSMKDESRSFAVIEKGRMDSEDAIIIVENGKYLGYGFTPKNRTPKDFHSLKENIEYQKDNREVQLILQSYLLNHKGYRVIFPESL